MNPQGNPQGLAALIHDLAVEPIARLIAVVRTTDRPVLLVLLAAAAFIGFAHGRRRTLRDGGDRAFGVRLVT